jgi:hypothetical protein
MVVEEGFLGRRGPLASSDTILLHRRFGHVNAQLVQFPNDPGRAPRWICLPHVSDQLAHLLSQRRATWSSLLTQAPPVVPKALLLPGDHRTGLDEYQGLAPTRPEPSQPRPDYPISRIETRAMNSLSVDCQLMPQG